MDKNVIKQIILNQQDFIGRIKLQSRNVCFEENANYVLVGIRRAGKSYMLYQHIQHLVANGHSIEEMLFINFEDERISDIRKEDLYLVLEAYRELFAFQPIIFSFSEYLEYHNIHLPQHWELSPIRADVVRLFSDYFYYGGLSEVFDIQDKKSWLQSLYQKILYSDIVMRKGVRNERSLRLLIRKLADSVMQPTAIKRLQDILQGDGTKITRDTIGSYLDYLHESYLTFGISSFTDSVSQRESVKKRYFYDNGILNLFLFLPETKLLENLVAIKLYNKYGDDLYYYNKNVEVDFCVPNDGLLIQASYRIIDEATRNREIGALQKLSKFIKPQRCIIVTYDQEEIIQSNDLDVQIEVIPAYKFMLMAL